MNDSLPVTIGAVVIAVAITVYLTVFAPCALFSCSPVTEVPSRCIQGLVK